MAEEREINPMMMMIEMMRMLEMTEMMSMMQRGPRSEGGTVEEIDEVDDEDFVLAAFEKYKDEIKADPLCSPGHYLSELNDRDSSIGRRFSAKTMGNLFSQGMNVPLPIDTSLIKKGLPNDEIYRLIETYGPSCSKSSKDRQVKRDRFNEMFSWSVPSKELIDEITRLSNDTILSLGSGRAFIERLVQSKGGKIVATDIGTSGGYYNDLESGTFMDVESIGYKDALKKYSDSKTLLMSWPPQDDPMAVTALKEFKGDFVVYIGEGQGGCTATDEFFDEVRKSWDLVKKIEIPRWSEIYDYGFILKRKE